MAETVITETATTLYDVVYGLSLVNDNIVNFGICIIVLLSALIGIALVSFFIGWFR